MGELTRPSLAVLLTPNILYCVRRRVEGLAPYSALVVFRAIGAALVFYVDGAGLAGWLGYAGESTGRPAAAAASSSRLS